MIFEHSWTDTWLWILGFGVAYLLYVWRLWRVSRLIDGAPGKMLYKFVLRSVFLLMCLIALLRPSWGTKQTEVEVESKDIFFCVDLSRSMNAEDIAPSRVEKVKYELKKLSEAFEGNRMGLIIFSEEAFLQCPLTYDLSALRLFIETLHTGLVPRGGTNFSSPLRLGYEKLIHASKSIETSTAQLLVLVSDGEDFGRNTDETLQKLKDAHIRVFTLGIGTKEGANIPHKRSFRMDSKGRPIRTKLLSQSLEKISEETYGKYFEINAKESQVAQLIGSIDAIQGTLQSKTKVDVSANSYAYFLGIACILFIIDAIWRVKLFYI